MRRLFFRRVSQAKLRRQRTWFGAKSERMVSNAGLLKRCPGLVGACGLDRVARAGSSGPILTCCPSRLESGYRVSAWSGRQRVNACGPWCRRGGVRRR